MKGIFCFLVLLIASCNSPGQHIPPGSPVAGSSINSSQWIKDIDFLQKEIIRLHPDPFYKNKNFNRQKFDSLFNDIRNNVAVWNENKIVTELTRIIGLMNDGHTAIDPFADARSFYSFKFFPLFLYYFPEGIFVTGATEQNKNLVGKKLIAIDNMPIEQVIKLFRPIISKDYNNETGLKDGLRFSIIISQYLHGLGIIKNADEAVFSFSDANGNRTDAKLTAGNIQSLFSAFDRSGNEGKPLYRQDPMKMYWYRYLGENKTLYIKHTMQMVDSTLPPDAFCRKLQDVVDGNEVEKVVLDLRQGQGGNILTLKPLYNFLLQPKVNQAGKLFVLMDRRTQSAGTVLAIRLSMISKAILIGEPAVSATNFFHNDRKIVLPNSKIRLGISTGFLFAGFPVDNRIEFPAEIPMEITAKDFFAMKDPVFDYTLQYKAANSVQNSGITNENIGGLYKYSTFKVIEVFKTEGKWKVRIPDGNMVDFLNTSLYQTGNNNFATDMKGITISTEKDKLILITPWGKMEFQKLPVGYESPDMLIQNNKIAEAAAAITKLHSSASPVEMKDFEAAVNSWGYQLLNRQQVEGAITIFKLNTGLFSKSANVWDSLGEAYAIAGNKEEAIRCYKKALEITPGLISATKALEKLQ